MAKYKTYTKVINDKHLEVGVFHNGQLLVQLFVNQDEPNEFLISINDGTGIAMRDWIDYAESN